LSIVLDHCKAQPRPLILSEFKPSYNSFIGGKTLSKRALLGEDYMGRKKWAAAKPIPMKKGTQTFA